MSTKLSTSALVCLALLAGAATPALAQNDWKKDWALALSQSKGQKLAIAVHPLRANVATVEAFAKRHPQIKVELTQMSANMFAPRASGEQKAGIFAWDSYVGQIATITETLLPLKGLANINEYLLLPEVKDPSNYRAPKYLFSELGPYAITFSLPLEGSAWADASLTKGLDMKNPQTLLDPRLRGKIVIRTPDRPTAGAVTLAAIMLSMGEKGPDFVRRVLTDTQPTFIDNPQQAATTMMRGSAAVLLGGEPQMMGRCKLQGGCRTALRLPYGHVLSTRAVVILRNAPHPAAAKVWLNWFLSKEGQETYVRETAKVMPTSAVSMRKDVAPAPGHESSLPDYAKADTYLINGAKDGQKAIVAVMDIFRSVRSKSR
jgi:iron(III) transport system substrate-binding protein